MRITGTELRKIIKEEISRMSEGYRALTPVEGIIRLFFNFGFAERLGLRPDNIRDPGLHVWLANWLKHHDEFEGYKDEEYDEAAVEIALRLGDNFRGSEEGREYAARRRHHYERGIENPYGPESDD